MRFSLKAAYAVAIGLACAGTAAAEPVLGYALSNGGTRLHTFNVTSPGSASALTLSGAVNSLDDIDFRPLTGELYGYNDASDVYVTINLMTGVTTTVSIPPVVPTTSDRLGIDFNPTIDRARVITETDENIVFNPNTGGTTGATPLFYVPGDPNADANPLVAANAYTNSVFGSAVGTGSTTQYVIDSNLDILAILNNNTGELTTVGSLGLNASQGIGLDILYDPISGTNTAYALMNVNSQSGLYRINLTTGSASFIGAFDANLGTVRGLAVRAVPEPSSIVMVAAGGLGLFALSRRRGLRPRS